MKPKDIKDPVYLRYIEKQPCMLCGHLNTGYRFVYNEYTDSFDEKPCRNTAHHCDMSMTRTKNDHKTVPLCGHYTISGKSTNDCHRNVHAFEGYKTKESRKYFENRSIEYYEGYCTKTLISSTKEDDKND